MTSSYEEPDTEFRQQKKEIEQLARAHDILKKEVDQLLEDKARRRKENSLLREECEELHRKFESSTRNHQAEIDHLRHTFSSQLSSAERDAKNTAQQTIDRVEDARRLLQNKLTRAESNLSASEATISELESKCSKLIAEKTMMQREISALQLELTDKKSVTGELQSHLREAQQEIATLKQTQQQFMQEFNSAKSTSQSFQESGSNDKSHLISLRQMVKSLQESETALREECNRLRTNSAREVQNLREATSKELSSVSAKHQVEMDRILAALDGSRRQLSEAAETNSCLTESVSELSQKLLVRTNEVDDLRKRENSSRVELLDLQMRLNRSEEKLLAMNSTFQQTNKVRDDYQLLQETDQQKINVLFYKITHLKDSLHSHLSKDLIMLNSLYETLQLPGKASDSLPELKHVDNLHNGSAENVEATSKFMEWDCEQMWERVTTAARRVVSDLKDKGRHSDALSSQIDDLLEERKRTLGAHTAQLGERESEVKAAKEKLEIQEKLFNKKFEKVKTKIAEEASRLVDNLKKELNQLQLRFQSLESDKLNEVTDLSAQLRDLRLQLDDSLSELQSCRLERDSHFSALTEALLHSRDILLSIHDHISGLTDSSMNTRRVNDLVLPLKSSPYRHSDMYLSLVKECDETYRGILKAITSAHHSIIEAKGCHVAQIQALTLSLQKFYDKIQAAITPESFQAISNSFSFSSVHSSHMEADESKEIKTMENVTMRLDDAIQASIVRLGELDTYANAKRKELAAVREALEDSRKGELNAVSEKNKLLEELLIARSAMEDYSSKLLILTKSCEGLQRRESQLRKTIEDTQSQLSEKDVQLKQSETELSHFHDAQKSLEVKAIVLTNELNDSKEEQQHLKNCLEELANDFDNSKASKKKLQKEVSDLKERLKSSEKELVSTLCLIRELESKEVSLNEKLHVSFQQIQMLTQALDASKEDLQQLQNSFKSLQEVNTSTRALLAENQAAVVKLQLELQEVCSSESHLKQQIDLIRNESDRTIKDLEYQLGAKEEMNNTLIRLQHATVGQQEHLLEMQRQLERTSTLLLRSEEQCEQYRSLLEKKSSEVMELHFQGATDKKLIETLQQHVAQANDEVVQLKSDLLLQKNALQSVDTEMVGLRDQLASMRQHLIEKDNAMQHANSDALKYQNEKILLSHQLESTRSDIDEIRSTLALAETQKASARNEIEELQLSLRQYEIDKDAMIKNHKKQLLLLNGTLEKYDNDRNGMEEILDKHSAKIIQLEEIIRNLHEKSRQSSLLAIQLSTEKSSKQFYEESLQKANSELGKVKQHYAEAMESIRMQSEHLTFLEQHVENTSSEKAALVQDKEKLILELQAAEKSIIVYHQATEKLESACLSLQRQLEEASSNESEYFARMCTVTGEKNKLSAMVDVLRESLLEKASELDIIALKVSQQNKMLAEYERNMKEANASVEILKLEREDNLTTIEAWTEQNRSLKEELCIVREDLDKQKEILYETQQKLEILKKSQGHLSDINDNIRSEYENKLADCLQLIEAKDHEIRELLERLEDQSVALGVYEESGKATAASESRFDNFINEFRSKEIEYLDELEDVNRSKADLLDQCEILTETVTELKIENGELMKALDDAKAYINSLNLSNEELYKDNHLSSTKLINAQGMIHEQKRLIDSLRKEVSALETSLAREEAEVKELKNAFLVVKQSEDLTIRNSELNNELDSAARASKRAIKSYQIELRQAKEAVDKLQRENRLLCEELEQYHEAMHKEERSIDSSAIRDKEKMQLEEIKSVVEHLRNLCENLSAERDNLTANLANVKSELAASVRSRVKDVAFVEELAKLRTASMESSGQQEILLDENEQIRQQNCQLRRDLASIQDTLRIMENNKTKLVEDNNNLQEEAGAQKEASKRLSASFSDLTGLLDMTLSHITTTLGDVNIPLTEALIRVSEELRQASMDNYDSVAAAVQKFVESEIFIENSSQELSDLSHMTNTLAELLGVERSSDADSISEIVTEVRQLLSDQEASKTKTDQLRGYVITLEHQLDGSRSELQRIDILLHLKEVEMTEIRNSLHEMEVLRETSELNQREIASMKEAELTQLKNQHLVVVEELKTSTKILSEANLQMTAELQAAKDRLAEVEEELQLASESGAAFAEKYDEQANELNSRTLELNSKLIELASALESKSELHQQLQIVTQQLEQTKKALESTKQKADSTENQCFELTSRVAVLDNLCKDLLQTVADDGNTTIDTPTEDDVRGALNKVLAYRNQISALNAQLTDLNEGQADTAAKISELERDHAQATQLKDEMQQALTEIGSRADSCDSSTTSDDLRVLNAELEDVCENLVVELKDAMNRLSALDEQLLMVNSKLDMTKKQLLASEASTKELRRESEYLEQHLNDSEEQRQILQQQLNNLQNTHVIVEAERNALYVNVDCLAGENAQLMKELETLKDDPHLRSDSNVHYNSLKQEADSLREQLLSQQDQLASILNTLVDAKIDGLFQMEECASPNTLVDAMLMIRQLVASAREIQKEKDALIGDVDCAVMTVSELEEAMATQMQSIQSFLRMIGEKLAQFPSEKANEIFQVLSSPRKGPIDSDLLAHQLRTVIQSLEGLYEHYCVNSSGVSDLDNSLVIDLRRCEAEIESQQLLINELKNEIHERQAQLNSTIWRTDEQGKELLATTKALQATKEAASAEMQTIKHRLATAVEERDRCISDLNYIKASINEFDEKLLVDSLTSAGQRQHLDEERKGEVVVSFSKNDTVEKIYQLLEERKRLRRLCSSQQLCIMSLR